MASTRCTGCCLPKPRHTCTWSVGGLYVPSASLDLPCASPPGLSVGLLMPSLHTQQLSQSSAPPLIEMDTLAKTCPLCP